ncbi:MAG TPA: glycosyltransferase [Roseococcus sp.]|jgi:glycosyltransferase involved in cell wall biosynthesis|nr:glycosyltransferase [Roseococcus sp.]
MARLLNDLTDLLHYFRVNRLPLGVPRVQMALTEAALAAPEPLLQPMAFDRASGRFRALPAEKLLALLATARRGADVEAPDWVAARATLAEALEAAPEIGFVDGDRVFTPGLPFLVPGQMHRLRELRQSRGVALCALFHDAIPLVVPEHCTPELTSGFADNLLSVCLQTDRVVATSACAARDFREWQRRLLPELDIPVVAMPLDAPLPPVGGGDEAAPWPEALADGRPYVLCVSTLESRKNHVLLLHAWLTLLRRHGEHALPRLVLVGRQGFGAEAALRLLEHAPELRRNVVWLRDVSDAQLARLYKGCLFTIFNSFYEGWGLPVTEALSHGKLVIAPDHSSLREAGGTAALYFTPQSEPELAELAWGLIRDPARRAALEAALPGRVRFRSWREVVEGLVRDLSAPLPALPEPFARAGSIAGRRIGFEIQPPMPPAAMRAAHVGNALILEGDGWSIPEAYGVWLTQGRARLRLPALERSGMRLFLEVSGPPVGTETGLRLHLPDGSTGEWLTLRLAAQERRHLEMTLPAGPAGDILVEFDTAGARPIPDDDRLFSLMLHGLMLTADHDLQRTYEYLGGRLHLSRLG